MLVTELGMVTLVRPLQPSNALCPMLVTELGITAFERIMSDAGHGVGDYQIFYFFSI